MWTLLRLRQVLRSTRRTKHVTSVVSDVSLRKVIVGVDTHKHIHVAVVITTLPPSHRDRPVMGRIPQVLILVVHQHRLPRRPFQGPRKSQPLQESYPGGLIAQKVVPASALANPTATPPHAFLHLVPIGLWGWEFVSCEHPAHTRFLVS